MPKHQLCYCMSFPKLILEIYIEYRQKIRKFFLHTPLFKLYQILKFLECVYFYNLNFLPVYMIIYLHATLICSLNLDFSTRLHFHENISKFNQYFLQFFMLYFLLVSYYANLIYNHVMFIVKGAPCIHKYYQYLQNSLQI